MLDRRSFLIAAGGFLTAAFVRKATAFSRAVREPLILPVAKKPKETLYIYENPPRSYRDYDDYDDYDCAGGAYYNVGKWRVSLGPDQPIAPPPSTWREYLRSRGHRLETDDDIIRACRQNGHLTLEELDRPLDAFGWQDLWDNFTGPQAKAHHLLKKLDLGCRDSKLREAGEIIFEAFGGAPGNSYHWVELKDDLTASLLQARLIELNLPIKVAVGPLR
jgi:hypothetical protein